MKALLYEPGTRGHGPVFLRYLAQRLEQRGIAYYALTSDLDDSVAEHNEVDWLTSIARREGCSHIHVMTFDGKGPEWLRYRSLRRSARIPVIATYYLFNNLYEFPNCLFWDLLFARNLVNKVIVMDDHLAERRLPFWRQRRLVYAPDPYDPNDFSPIEQSAARTKLGLRPDRVIFLMFGELSAGKGLMTLVDAVRKLPETDSACVLLAGRLAEDVKKLGIEDVLGPLHRRGRRSFVFFRGGLYRLSLSEMVQGIERNVYTRLRGEPASNCVRSRHVIGNCSADRVRIDFHAGGHTIAGRHHATCKQD